MLPARLFRRPALIGLAAAAALCGHAAADIIISNMPGNDGTQSFGLEGGRIKAMGFTMPRGQDYQLTDVVLRLDISSTGVNPLVRIFDDAGGLPGNELITLDNPPASVGLGNYTFVPPARFTLEQDRSYWIVVWNAGAPRMDWKASSPAQTPTGIATHFGSLFSTNTGPNPPTGSSSIVNSYEINGERVGAPCYPDCDGNEVLDFFDFLCFQNAFLAGDPYADCDGNTVLDFFDFLCFQNEFLAGCP